MKKKFESSHVSLRLSNKMIGDINDLQERNGFLTRTQTIVFLIQTGLLNMRTDAEKENENARY